MKGKEIKLEDLASKEWDSPVPAFQKGIYKAKNFLKQMTYSFIHGKKRGETTRFRTIDPHFTWKKGFVYCWTGYPNHGKALCLKTKIPTPSGWTTMGDIKLGDKVFDELGNVCNVTFVTNTQYERTCFKMIFSDNSFVICDDDHNWVTTDRKARVSMMNAKRNNRILPRDLKKRGVDQSEKRSFPSVKTTKEIRESLLVENDKRLNHSISICESLNLPDLDLTIDPYVLGCWLGDGMSRYGALTCGEEDINHFSKLGRFRKVKERIYTINIEGLTTKLRQSNLLKNKHIPEVYLRASSEQRISLLRGLMDTDGYIGKDGRCEFTTVKENLYKQVYELMVSLGIKAVVYTTTATINGKDCGLKYRISFMTEKDVFSLPRKRDKLCLCKKSKKNKIRYIVDCQKVESVPVRCITVDSPSHMYLCSESMIPTHNTELLLQLAIAKSIHDKWNWVLFLPENMGSSEVGEMTAEEIFDTLIHAYIGKTTDPYYKTSQMSMDEYLNGIEFVNTHFTIIYPCELKTPETILRYLQYVCETEKVDGIVLDPWNKMIHNYSGLLDEYLASRFAMVKDFAIRNHIIFNIVEHPKSVLKQADGTMPIPDAYSLRGGAMWNNAMDVIVSVFRPNYQRDKTDRLVNFISHKIRNQKLVGTPGTIDLEFDRKSNRYFEYDGNSPLHVIMLPEKKEDNLSKVRNINFYDKDEEKAPF